MSLKIKRLHLYFAAACFVSGTLTAAHAEGVYLAAGLGTASFNNLSNTALAADVVSVDRIQGGQFYKIGYDFSKNFAVEFGYDYLGKFKMDRGVANANEYSYNSAYSIAAIGRVAPISSAPALTLSGKVGYSSVTMEAKHMPAGVVSPYAVSGKGSALLGLGVEYAFTPSIAAGLNYDIYQNFGGLGSNLDTMHLALKYRF
jgi:hypothetical protein